jgi:two-component system, OmpR family, response regulator
LAASKSGTAPPVRTLLILMDVMMPVMDGPRTLEKLRLMPATRDIPVVFMTAKAQLHEQEAYMKLGAAGVIVKPFDPLTLTEQVEDVWNRTQPV